MKKPSFPRYFSSNILRSLLLSILILGIVFRFIDLGKKPYWSDETYTSAVVSGFSQAELIEKFSTNQPIKNKDFVRYQYPNSEKNLNDSLRILAVNSQDGHPPLFHVLEMLWLKWFGNSVSVLRSLSAFLSALALPCMYWLCLELFESPLAGLIGAALLAISPFHVIYAQEARPYSLLTLSILLTGAALMQATRLKSKLSWAIYAVTLAIGFYSHFFFIFVVFGYLIYILTIEHFRLTKTVVNFLISSTVGFAVFIPWLLIIFQNRSSFSSMSSWISTQELSFLGAVRIWADNISLAFFDLRMSSYFNLGNFGFYFLIPPILILVGYSIYFLYTKTPPKTYLFIFILIGSTAFSLILSDLVLGGNRQTWSRYIVACYLGIQLSVAYFLSHQVSSIKNRTRSRKLQLILISTIFSAGIFSCLINLNASTWWNKYGGERILKVAQNVNQTERPLVIVEQRPIDMIAISFSFRPDVYLLFVKDSNQVKIPSNFSNIFLINPTQTLLSELDSQGYQSKNIDTFPQIGMFQGMDFWKIDKAK
ncbi:MAG: glycosyltransferase family 39 protein [Scytolyngbya sp. HA4215-MV1]|jgi:uncharacterized membrane protein|nr:glycosyltransferase family 39 protein [Scytolyngbya sp. HA4215-MV1]